jgi:hypothetical protein
MFSSLTVSYSQTPGLRGWFWLADCKDESGNIREITDTKNFTSCTLPAYIMDITVKSSLKLLTKQTLTVTTVISGDSIDMDRLIAVSHSVGSDCGINLRPIRHR